VLAHDARVTVRMTLGPSGQLTRGAADGKADGGHAAGIAGTASALAPPLSTPKGESAGLTSPFAPVRRRPRAADRPAAAAAAGTSVKMRPPPKARGAVAV
jgi:hypothetical protein